jgi:hypothetical protein
MCRRKTKIELATSPHNIYERKPKKYAAIRGGKGYEHERGRVPHGGGGRHGSVHGAVSIATKIPYSTVKKHAGALGYKPRQRIATPEAAATDLQG